jgi:hypothetical protein
MKKILITLLIIGLNFNIITFGACKIDSLDACKADIGSGINDKLQDKVLPNNIQQMTKPNNTFNNRTNLGQPNIPSNIHMQSAEEELTQPYDANCQFGNCMNNTNAGKTKNY